MRTLALACLASVAMAATAGAETIELKASHQFPGGKGDVRDEMVQIIARDVAKADVGLKIQVFPGQSLFKATEQWQAMIRGQLDISAFPLDYASGRHGEFSATLMPGLVRNHDHAKRLNASPFMQDVKAVMAKAGVIVLADAWLAGAFGAKGKCIRNPDDAKGLKFRSAGRAFAEMWRGAGASIVSIPSSEVYSALQTGVAQATDTSSGSFVSFRLYEQITCITAPGNAALWFMYEPVLMAKKRFDSLNKKQQDALMAAGRHSQEFFEKEAPGLDRKMVEAFKKAGREVVELTDAQFDAWREVAKKTSYKVFAEKVKGGDKLIEKALAVK
ncbi:MAG: TRAP transporter substrate-binding protein DctP [Rhodospirillaceae bacterium]|nr:TRAP transporter substrate-binding protein DctP [Rhodospirillaceae bacterium]